MTKPCLREWKADGILRAALLHAIECYDGPDDDTIPVLHGWLARVDAAPRRHGLVQTYSTRDGLRGSCECGEWNSFGPLGSPGKPGAAQALLATQFAGHLRAAEKTPVRGDA